MTRMFISLLDIVVREDNDDCGKKENNELNQMDFKIICLITLKIKRQNPF